MKLFGTDGIRGVAGKYPLDDGTVRKIGAAAADVLKQNSSGRVIIIGRDTRESGEDIASGLSDEFSKKGLEVWDIGVIPTPGISYLATQYPVLAGVVISASHNPYTDNGIKFFSHTGTKLPDSVEESIVKRILEGNSSSALESRGKILSCASLADRYRNFITSSFPKEFKFDGRKIVLDCANGATCHMASAIFSSMGAGVLAVNTSPDGRNINLDSGSLHPANLSSEVVARNAYCGIAFDGDGDRVIFVDEKGQVRDGDYLLAIASLFLKEKQKLVNNTLVTTVMANLGMLRAMEKNDIDVITTPVGDRYVFEAMHKSGSILGGEQSGHIIFKKFLSTGDGMLSALQMLYIAAEKNKPFSSMCGLFEKYPQVLINAPVNKKIPVNQLIKTTKAINDAEGLMHSDGRIVVRYSGTENLLRVMIEGHDKAFITRIAEDIAQTAQNEIASKL